jgi:hypothetical protein
MADENALARMLMEHQPSMTTNPLMADGHDLASLMQGKPRPSETEYGPFGEKYDVEYVTPPPVASLLGMRFGFRGVPQAKFPGPWAAERPPAPGPAREWKQPGDDGLGQHVYEAILGRTREAGEAVAKPGSGWWHIGNQPIPKPTNVLPWAAAGGWGYLMNKLWGDPVGELWRMHNDPNSPEYKVRQPGTAEYNGEQKRIADIRNASSDQREARAKASPQSAMFEYGGANWPWDIDKYAGRKKDPGIPPLPDAPY